MLAPYDFSGIRVTPPTREFRGELTLDVGGREVRLVEVGPAHTPGDLVVHVPDARIVFAGDVLFVGVAPVMWAGPAASWIAALDRIATLDPAIVVPGHGPVSDRSEVDVLRQYLAWVDGAARSRLAAGAGVLDVARELVRSDEYRGAPWDWWDSPERIVITIATIDRHQRGAAGPVGARERMSLFAQVATLARELRTVT
jgi:glyoxylase-like metal-dependent hydrolase (beta-lactamase superfamily II)